MSNQDIMATIESLPFSVETNLAAGSKVFVHSMRTNPAFVKLLDMVNSESGRKSVLNRINYLLSQPIDIRLEHPADVAISAYIMALGTIDPDIVKGVDGLMRPYYQNLAWALVALKSVSNEVVA